jgi:NADH-quinone oxidoreductase subunit L
MPDTTYIALIPLLPMAAFILLGLFGRKYLGNSSGIFATILLLVSTALALYTAYGYFFDYGKVNGIYQTIVPLK